VGDLITQIIKECVMKFFASKRTQRLTNFALAAMLVTSTLTASVPFIFSTDAFAATVAVCTTTCDAGSIQAAIDSAAVGDTISFGGNATINHQLTINKNITIDGGGNTIFASFAKTGNDNNSAIGIYSDGVTVDNLTVDGAGGRAWPYGLHGINVYQANNVNLNNVTLKNNTYNGLTVNGSNVTVSNLHTSSNGWHGVDVDQGTGVTSPAVLNVAGVSTHSSELGGAIYVDNDTKKATVNDLSNQYTWARSGLVGRTHDRVYTLSPSQTSNTVVVTGNTSAAENSPGWMFNRDTTTATPFVFNNGAASTGTGSLFVKPIGSNPSDKFIGELFFSNQLLINTHKISYDINVASSGSTDYKQFYTNIYANYSGSTATHYYDCRYNVVPTSGPMGTFTTVTFDPTSNYTVTTHSGSPTCPAAPVDMGPGAFIRAIAINVGDTSANDAGVSGYLDNVVVNSSSVKTIYDFEAVPASPPTNLQWLNSTTSVPLGAYTNQNPVTPAWTAPATGTVDHYEYSYLSPTSGWSAWESVGNVTNLGPNSFYGAGNTGTEGVWQYRVRTINSLGIPSTEAYSPSITYDRTTPALTIVGYTGTNTAPTVTGTTNGGTDVVTVDGATATVSSTPNGAGTYNWTYTFPTLTVGSHTFPVVSTDSNGNSSTKTVSVTVEPVLLATTTPTTQTPTVAAIPTLTPTTTITPTITSPAAAAVLGATTTNDNTSTGDTGVKGTTDDKTAAAATNSDANKGTIFGLAWYWWILILAALAAIAWFIIAAIRRRNEEQA
jgi:hypothetical protein